MAKSRVEVVEISTCKVVHTVPCPGESPSGMQRVLRGVLNNIGRFDVRLCRPLDDDAEAEDNRLDTDRFFARIVDRECA